MKLLSGFGNLVRSLNTVHVGTIGLGSALTSAATIIFAPKLTPYVNAHTSGLVQYSADQIINAAYTAAQSALAPSIFAAWAGMPKPVATPPVPPQPPVSTGLMMQRDSNAV